MEFALLILLLSLSTADDPPPSETFEVRSAQSFYQVFENKDVTLEWTFTSSSLESLYIYCFVTIDDKNSVLLKYDKGHETPVLGLFEGRVQWDKDVLRERRIRLHVSSLRTGDSGEYTCEVETREGLGEASCRVNVTGCDFSAKVGETVILRGKHKSKLKNPTIRWLNGSNQTVHNYVNNKDYYVNQIERFKNRTSLFTEEFNNGNFSLKIINITKEDEGKYIYELQNKDPHKEDISKHYYYLCVTEKDKHQGPGPVQNQPGPDQPGPTKSPNPEPKPSLTAGLIAGIVIGVLVPVGLIGVVAVILYKKCKGPNNNGGQGDQAHAQEMTPLGAGGDGGSPRACDDSQEADESRTMIDDPGRNRDD